MATKAELAKMSVEKLEYWRDTFRAGVAQNKGLVHNYLNPPENGLLFITPEEAQDALESAPRAQAYLDQVEGELERRKNAENE